LSISSEPHFSISKIYKPAGIEISNLIQEVEGKVYQAYRLTLNSNPAIFRVAKTTPTKIGQFVTLWQRSEITGNIEPFSENDDLGLVIIHTANKDNIGQFIFTKDILIKKGIIASSGKQGKLGIRIYPPWSTPTSKLAIETQKWQLQYFFDLSQKNDVDPVQTLRYFQRIIGHT
jgi:hypothetical protein